MAYTGVYVFGDSLVDAGNALKLAQWYGGLPFSDLPDGAPTAEEGYFQGRFTNGFSFADLIANKAIGTVTKPVFPYGFEDPWIGIPIAPFAGDPSGNNLNFAYGGAQVRQGNEVVQDLDSQTDTFRDAVDGDAPPGALYIVTMGGNDVRNLAKVTGNPADELGGYAALDKVVQQLIHELGQLIDDGARSFLITGMPDVGIIPDYDVDDSNSLDAAEQMRADAGTLFSQYLDLMIRTEVVPELEAMGATVTYVPMMDYQDGATTVTGGLNAILPTLEALNQLDPGTLTTNLLEHRSLVFFDDVHPTAQVHALFGSYAQAMLAGSPWVETLPLTGADVDYSLTASIAAPGEVDSLVIALVAGTNYRFDMLGMSSLGTAGTLADPSLRLLNSSGSTRAVNADDGAGFDAVLTFNPAVSSNFTLQLSATGNVTGSYTLQATVVGGAAMQAGNSYTVTNAATLVLEGAGGLGVDAVKASVSYALAAGSEIELLTTTNAKGKGAINLTGNEFDQQITGNAGANRIEGKGGADTLTGGAGKDVFVLGGGAVDTITDYANADVVDVSQVLNVAAGVNVVSDGYVRVTTGGLIQVDANGGGDQWVTLGQINNGGAVTVRYLSGGTATNVSVGRVAANSNNVLAAAIAAAGLMAAPAAAETTAFSGDEYSSSLIAAATGTGFEQSGISIGASDPGPLAGETRGAAFGDQAVAGGSRMGAAVADHGEPGIVNAGLPAAPMTQLAQGTELPAISAPVFADAVAMPSAAMLQAIVAAQGESGAQPSGDIGRILADALGGGGDAPSIDALLAALPGHAEAAVEPGHGLEAIAPQFGLTLPMEMPGIETIAMHPDTAVAV